MPEFWAKLNILRKRRGEAGIRYQNTWISEHSRVCDVKAAWALKGSCRFELGWRWLQLVVTAKFSLFGKSSVSSGCGTGDRSIGPSSHSIASVETVPRGKFSPLAHKARIDPFPIKVGCSRSVRCFSHWQFAPLRWPFPWQHRHPAFSKQQRIYFMGGRGDASGVSCWYFCGCVFRPFALSVCSLSPPILCTESAELLPVGTKGSYQKHVSLLFALAVEGTRGLNEHLLLPGCRMKNCNNISMRINKNGSNIFHLSSLCIFLQTT